MVLAEPCLIRGDKSGGIIKSDWTVTQPGLSSHKKSAEQGDKICLIYQTDHSKAYIKLYVMAVSKPVETS